MSEKVRVLYGTRIGQVGRIVERHAEQIPVYRGGLLPDIFPGPSGLAGYVPGRTAWVVEFDDGGRLTYDPAEVEVVRKVVRKEKGLP